ncbi:hypothetical protein J6590_053737 [Homalodisca vitripennis]|nr:hypothetical protein J6590_053737 [Homalodisca vitripennis]
MRVAITPHLSVFRVHRSVCRMSHAGFIGCLRPWRFARPSFCAKIDYAGRPGLRTIVMITAEPQVSAD